jgi:hypothetical protein
MNALQRNEETGFLESQGYSGATFDSSRKLQFINLAEEHFKTTGNMPDLVSIAEAVMVSPRTVENHLRDDPGFAEAWRNIRLRGKWKLESKMYEYAQGKGGYMHMITWLRKEFPEEYNPDIRIQSSTDFSWIKKLQEAFNPPVIATDATIVSTPNQSEQSNASDM